MTRTKILQQVNNKIDHLVIKKKIKGELNKRDKKEFKNLCQYHKQLTGRL